MNTNPFSTCFFQPGAIRYEFFGAKTIESLASECLRERACQLIVGPHGSGKSTLLRSLQAAIDQQTRSQHSLLIPLHADGQAWQVCKENWNQWSEASAILLDGLEQLTRLRRFWLIRRARWMKRPLIATAHYTMLGCRVIWRTSIDAKTERWVLERLLRDVNPEVIEQAISSESWKVSRQKHQQNLRESLFDMYDWWQQHGNSIR